MVISLLSIVYGALRCNILAIKIRYDDYEVDVRPGAYLCIFLWRSFEIATRVTVLVLFSSVLQIWVLPVVLVNFLLFTLYPWVLFWHSGSPFPENIEKTLTRVGTTIVLALLTFLYAGINMFCWSAVQLRLCDPDLIDKAHSWRHVASYYGLRFLENGALTLLWHAYQTDVYRTVDEPVLALLLLVGYSAAIFFMLLFYQFCHPCRRLFATSVSQGMWECCGSTCFLLHGPNVVQAKGSLEQPPLTDMDSPSGGDGTHATNGDLSHSFSSNP